MRERALPRVTAAFRCARCGPTTDGTCSQFAPKKSSDNPTARRSARAIDWLSHSRRRQPRALAQRAPLAIRVVAPQPGFYAGSLPRARLSRAGTLGQTGLALAATDAS